MRLLLVQHGEAVPEQVEPARPLSARGAADVARIAEFLAAVYGALGDPDEAFLQLDRAYADRSAGLIYLHLDPLYDPLRDDPRFGALVEKIGLK